MGVREIEFGGIAVRLGVALGLVLLTYNPSGASYYHWALRDLGAFTPIKAVPGALLLCGWVLYVRAAFTSLGWLGLTLSSIVFAALVWWIADLGWIDPDRPGVLTWVSLVVFALILGIGLSWSHVRRRITGQVDVDELPG